MKTPAGPLALIAALLLLVACAGDPGAPGRADGPTTVVLVLHPETDPVYMDRLSLRGEARAGALPAAVAGYDISAIYYTSYRRNHQTVQPLADQLGIAPRQMPVQRKFYGEYNAPRLVERLLAEHGGEVVVWVGTTDSISPLYTALGGPTRPPVAPGEAVAVTVSPGGEAVERRFRFGD